jgi:hypothetical protein
MNDETITCRYVFSSVEFRRAKLCYWRTSSLKWWMAGVVLFLFGLVIYPDLFPDAATSASISKHHSFLFSVFLDILPIIIFVSCMPLALFFLPQWSFRKGPFFNREMAYVLGAQGVHVETPLVSSDLKWESFAKITENHNGFALFLLGKRSFQWLPKSGLEAPEKVIDCRNLFRRHVKDSRGLKSN